MTSPKKRGRARRRVERTMEEAFLALERGERALADKLSRRATEEGHVNPRIWHDRARVASSLGDEESAEFALRQAIAIAPGYSEAHADLGRLLSRHGRTRGARRALARALQSCSHDPRVRAAIEAELAALPEGEAGEMDQPDSPPTPCGDVLVVTPPTRTAGVDWAQVETGLTTRGLVRLPRFLEPGFASSVIPDRPGESPASPGEIPSATPEREASSHPQRLPARVRYLPKPLPPKVDALRAELFEGLVDIASRWARRFARPAELPRSWSAMAGADPGSRVDVGFAWLGVDRPHGPLRVPPTRPDFPFRILAALEVPPEGIVRHELIDLRPGRKRHGVAVELRQGDLVIASARTRIVSVGGINGLQEVAHRSSLVGGSGACVLFAAFGGLG